MTRRHPRHRAGMGSVIAVATLGLCAVAVGSVAALVRMDVQRTQRLAHEAQALALLSAGADAAMEAAGDDEGLMELEGDRALPLPLGLAEQRDVTLTFSPLDAQTEGERESVSIEVRAMVEGTHASQRLRFMRGEDTSRWRVHAVELVQLFSSP